MKKTIIYLILISVFLLSFAGCAPDKKPIKGGNSSPTSGNSENAQVNDAVDSAVTEAPVSQETAVSDNAVSEPSVSQESNASKKEDLGSNDKTEVVSEPTQSGAGSSNSNASPVTGAVTQAQISKEEAKNIALWNAKVTGSEIRDYEIELDRDGGVLHYEISFKFQNIEFDYEINASDGTIIKAEKEFDD